MTRDLMNLPSNLPIPEDDGACDHLSGMRVPSIQLLSTAERMVDLALESKKPTVVFIYPRTGEPNKPAPSDWDLIPGARGCTPQSCGFRDLHKEFEREGFNVYGLSSQDSDYQKEFARRNHIPFEILSDKDFKFTDALNLPTFKYNSVRLIKRMAFILQDGKFKKVFYPVFPPNENAEAVLQWVRGNRS